MKKKGFTLIELLAVIIILAIIALIATPIVLDVVNDVKKSTAKTEAIHIIDAVNKYCALSDAKTQLDVSYTNPCVDGVSNEELKEMVEGGNYTSATVEYDGTKVTSATIESNGYTVKYDGKVYTIDGEVVETPEEPVEPPAPTYAAYSVGDVVTLTDGTTWIVIKDTDSSESEIKLSSEIPVKANLTTETGTAIFSSGAMIAYDDDSNVWENSTLKAYLDGTVKTRLEASLNTTISDVTILGAEDLEPLGCGVAGNETDGYNQVGCRTNAWNSKLIEFSMLKLHAAGTSDYIVYFDSAGPASLRVTAKLYVHPVITISKSIISQ